MLCFLFCLGKTSAGLIHNPKNLTQKQVGKVAFLAQKCEKQKTLISDFFFPVWGSNRRALRAQALRVDVCTWCKVKANM